MTLQDLNNCFQDAISVGARYIGVKINMQGFDRPETIINPTENFETKLAYYQKAYNDDLTLKSFNGIKIVGFTYGETFDDLEQELME